MSSIEKSSSAESKPVASLDLTHEPSLEPWTPKERILHPLEFLIKFKDYGNTSKHFWHNPLEASPKVEPSKEWLMEVKRSSESIQILSPSMAMPCSLRGTNIKAIHNPTIGTSIMLEFLAKNLLGNMALVLTNKLFQKSFGTVFWVFGDHQGRASHNWQNRGFHRLPYLCHPWVWYSLRPPSWKSYSRKTFPWGPWWKVGNNCFCHSHPLSWKTKGEAATQP